jgi:hypothetical protein
MSGKSTDSESIPNDNNKRSYSLLRQVHAKFRSRNRLEIKGKSLSLFDTQKLQSTSLFNQVKLHIIRKCNNHRTISSTSNNDYLVSLYYFFSCHGRLIIDRDFLTYFIQC